MSVSVLELHYDVPGDDFTRAGEASSAIKNKLKQMGIDPDVIRNVAIATYEGEINMVIHANGGTIDVTIDSDAVALILKDTGAGIPDVELAMREGYTTAKEEIRALGFGAGMGLPNMKKYTDEFELKSEVGVGTEVNMKVYLKK
ncbi:MAG: ATP-binding protein [Oscillospiraceae bacterium]|nr:ATP-binding protein [Oscillospiraceae bacterium]